MIEVERVKHMLVEEAIEVLAQDLPCETDEDLSEAMTMAIKALEQQPCEDVVSRECNNCAYYVNGANEEDEACDGCFADEYEHPNFKPKAQHYEDCISRQAVIEITAETGALETQTRVKSLPSVTPKEKTGKWIGIKNSKGTVIALRCSHCGNSPKRAISSDFCPNCGARMVSE